MKELITISSLGIVTLLLEILRLRKLIFPIVIIGLLTVIGFCVVDFNKPQNVYNMLFIDSVGYLLTIVLCSITLIWILLNRNITEEENTIADYISLVLFSLAGGFILINYVNFSMLFLGVEILSIPLYILVATNKTDVYGNEASYKYLIMGAFATCFLLMGICFLYGSTGSFDIRNVALAVMQRYGFNAQFYLLGLLFVLFAMSFKTAVAPFHYWSPDVYTGAPARITAFMTTVAKAAAWAGFLRLFVVAMGIMHAKYANVLLCFGLLSIVLGNFIATTQNNIKRLLAFSGISHSGFVFLAMASLSIQTHKVVVYYIIAYTISSITLFAVVGELERRGINTIEECKGLLRRNALLASAVIISLLSMSGIPPLAGFFAKYYVLTELIQHNYIWIAVIAILCSLVAIYYYFKLILAVFQEGDSQQSNITLGTTTNLILIILSILIIAIGLFSNIIYKLV